MGGKIVVYIKKGETYTPPPYYPAGKDDLFLTHRGYEESIFISKIENGKVIDHIRDSKAALKVFKELFSISSGKRMACLLNAKSEKYGKKCIIKEEDGLSLKKLQHMLMESNIDSCTINLVKNGDVSKKWRYRQKGWYQEEVKVSKGVRFGRGRVENGGLKVYFIQRGIAFDHLYPQKAIGLMESLLHLFPENQIVCLINVETNKKGEFYPDLKAINKVYDVELSSLTPHILQRLGREYGPFTLNSINNWKVEEKWRYEGKIYRIR
jgi:aspartate carbamoyltransferase regulatory subunit